MTALGTVFALNGPTEIGSGAAVDLLHSIPGDLIAIHGCDCDLADRIAVLPDTREAVTGPLVQRAGGANGRLTRDLDAAVGPTADPALFRSAMDAGYARDVPQLYRQALAQPVTVDTAPVLATIKEIAEQESESIQRTDELFATAGCMTTMPRQGSAQSAAPRSRYRAMSRLADAGTHALAALQSQRQRVRRHAGKGCGDLIPARLKPNAGDEVPIGEPGDERGEGSELRTEPVAFRRVEHAHRGAPSDDLSLGGNVYIDVRATVAA